MAALINRSTSPDEAFFGHVCGAALIDIGAALTAAHCVRGRLPSEVDLLIGQTNLCSEPDLKVQRIETEAVIPHPLYDETTGAYDIAIIVPRRALGSQYPLTPPELGERVVAYGWGRQPGGGAHSCELVAHVLDVVPPSYCDSEEATMRGYRLFNDHQFCAVPSRGSSNTCIGDSGGPVVSDYQGRRHLVGIVSWGLGCGPADGGGYIAVQAVADWIRLTTTQRG